MALFGRKDDFGYDAHDGGDADSRRRLGLAVVALVAVVVAGLVIDLAFRGPAQSPSQAPEAGDAASEAQAPAASDGQDGDADATATTDGASDQATEADAADGTDEVTLSGITFSGASHLSSLDPDVQTSLGRAVRVWLDARGKTDVDAAELTRDADSSTTGATVWVTAGGTDAVVSITDSWAVADDEGTVTLSMTDEQIVKDPTPVEVTDEAALEAVIGSDAASSLDAALDAWAAENGVDVTGATVSPSSAAPGADGTSIDFRVDLASGSPVMATYDTTAQQFSFSVAQ